MTAGVGDEVLPPALGRVARLVWPDGAGGHRLVRERPPDAVDLETYLVLPHLGRPRFLLPLDAPRAARTQVLLRYNQLRSDRRRAVRAVLAGAVRVGLPRPRPGHNVVHALPSRVSLLEVVAAGLGEGSAGLVLSTGIQARTGPARPTLNVTDTRGRPRAFVKVAVTPAHRTALEREHDVLADFARRPAAGLLVPRPLFRTEWEGALVVGVEALPDDVRRVRARHRDRVRPWLQRLVDSRPRHGLRLADSPWLAQLQSTAARLPEPWRAAGLAAVHRVVTRHGDRSVPHGLHHGDWSPWNMAWTRDGRLALWDWEFAEELAPCGLDEWSWQFAVDTSMRRLPFGAAAERLRAAAADPGAELACELVLLDMAVRRAVQAAQGNRSSARYAEELFGVLGHEAEGRA